MSKTGFFYAKITCLIPRVKTDGLPPLFTSYLPSEDQLYYPKLKVKQEPSSLFQALVLFIALFLPQFTAQAQSGQCNSDVPFFVVDLRGQPGGSFTTPDVTRDDQCCSAASNENCVEFEVYLDPRASGLAFDVTSGPMPGGSMFYQINCGTPISVGDSTCASGTGPQILTICMPGKASNQFTVYSVVAYEETPDINVTEGCSGTIEAPLAFDPTSVTYNDITGGGSYNSYLSCTTGCAQTTVTPDASAPAFVDYVICGNTNASGCVATPKCDTVRVNFFPRIQVSIDPDPALICSSGTTLLQGQVSGGSGGPYTYIWYDAADGLGNVVGSNINYTATAAGTYSLEVRNENYPDCTPFLANVDVNDNFSIGAGDDQSICADAGAVLNGNVQGATGGIWSGGSGAFSPDNQTLNATYTPTQTEIDAGGVTLTLTSTGNGNCTPGTDQVTINIYEELAVTLSGPPTLCNAATTTITANVTGGSGNYAYLWDSGETTASIVAPAGTYAVGVTDLDRGCDIKNSITITQLNGPTDALVLVNHTTCGRNNGDIGVNSVTGGVSPFSVSLDDITYQSSRIFTDLVAGNYTVYIQDANGCKFTSDVTVNDTPGPSLLTLDITNTSCGNSDGEVEVTAVTGGTGPFEYSMDGTNFQTSPQFSGLAAGTYQVGVRDANNCRYNEDFTITDNGGPSGAIITTVTASCTDDDGSISVANVVDGTAPYQYSIDGSNFQSASSFSGLASGSYAVFIRDTNGCTYTENVTVGSEAPSSISAISATATCGLANGSISVDVLVGGTAPYSYSIDGILFQSNPTLHSSGRRQLHLSRSRCTRLYRKYECHCR